MDAFLQDIGITSELHPVENCPNAQSSCMAAPNGGTPEMPAERAEKLLLYVRTIAVPAMRNIDDPIVRNGAARFVDAGCAVCHVPTFKTGASDLEALSHQTIHPFTDLLLHEMGPGLADNRPDQLASGTEWRTPPLWGIGLIEAVNGHTTSETATDEAQVVVDEWTGSGTASGSVAYADVFTGKAASSLLPLTAVSAVVRTSIFLLRTVVEMQLEEALGLEGCPADLDELGEVSAGNGVADLRDAVVGMKAAYFGTETGEPPVDTGENTPRGLSDLVSGVSTDADARVGEAYTSALNSTDALTASGESLTWLVVHDREAVLNALSALEHLQITLNTEVVSLLGISVGFADTDGDGG